MAPDNGTLFVDEAHPRPLSIIEQIEQRVLEPTPTEVECAVSIIQRHLEKEARNRQVSILAPKDLCPAQKRDMIRDLVRLFKG